MNRVWVFWAIGAAAIGTWAAAGMLSVQVQQSPVRGAPSFLGGVVDTVAYGDRVTKLEQNGPWVKVTTGRQVTGWMHESALTAKRVVLKGANAPVDTGASSQEVSLAGKGFSEDVERRYRTDNPRVNFEAVNRMEKREVSVNDIVEFAAEGGLKGAR